MKEAYIKAIKVINSCKTSIQLTSAYNYIWNFGKLFIHEKGQEELSKKLYEKCNRRRKLLGDKR